MFFCKSLPEDRAKGNVYNDNDGAVGDDDDDDKVVVMQWLCEYFMFDYYIMWSLHDKS